MREEVKRGKWEVDFATNRKADVRRLKLPSFPELISLCAEMTHLCFSPTNTGRSCVVCVPQALTEFTVRVLRAWSLVGELDSGIGSV